MKVKEQIVNENCLTKEEFLEKYKDLLEQYTIPIDENNKFIYGHLGNAEDRKKANFTGIYVILENNKVIYIGSALPPSRTIEVRFREHLFGHYTNTKIVSHLMKTRNLNNEQAKALIRTFDFLAFKYSSLEYLLIKDTPGIINSSGKPKK